MKTLKRILNIHKTKNSYKNVVWFYDAWSAFTESKAVKKALKLAEIKDEQKIIEIACGTGTVFSEIVKQNPNGNNLGIDLSPAMLSKAKKRLKNLDTKNYTLMESDVLNLNIKDETYDVLINNYMIDLMPEETFDTIASEFYRILKPNGIAVITTFSHGTKTIHKFWSLIAKHIPGLLTGCRPVSIENILTDSGFVIEVEIEISQNTFPSKIYKLRKIC